MNGFNERRNQDLIKLNQLALESKGKIKVVSKSGNPLSQLVIELNYPTVSNSNYPNIVQQKSQIVIDLTSKYPFTEPTVSFRKPIVFHPNVYESGRICFGTKWLPTQGLELLVKRVIKIITFETDILNESSPANSNALTWYRKAVREYPNKFPTTKMLMSDNTKKTKVSWNNIT